MLKIWGRLNSLNVKKVVWCAAELGLPFERIDAGGPFGGLDTPDFLARNPNGTIPLIDDDGFTLWESNAIVRYLAAKYGHGSLYPDDLQQRADADRWMDWQATVFNPALVPAIYNLLRVAPEQRNQEAIDTARVKVDRLAGLLEQHLTGRTWLTGERFTMADIALGCSVHLWLNLPLERTPRSELERWYTALRARPASAEALRLPLS
ncbi:glutathione S-transferase family protein [Pseudogulbenkiania subflava]|uniref:Glutathione S-transferase n=1 Tax=Pseudogulbenkiania subflava DSM 22618 TaxID=1123014 RepID=A0A1Y6BES9_9NEIS|nr:glutathione S-transferase family protein [Pseudogulbenkiania subflava]SMF07556.1 Glutathione S-transferase [Pseudogulbenkiania subflava DSM 22618]